MHIVGANYFILGFAGVKPPAGLDKDMEKTVTEKAKVIDELKKSFAHVRAGVTGLSDADLDKPVKMFGFDYVGPGCPPHRRRTTSTSTSASPSPTRA